MADPTDDRNALELSSDRPSPPVDGPDIGTELDDPDDDGGLPQRDELGEGQDIAFAFG